MSRLGGHAAGWLDPNDLKRWDYEGAPRTGMALQLYGMFHDCSSIPNVCGQLARHLRAVVPALALQSYTGRPFFDPALEALAGMDPEAPVAFFYGVPDAIEDPVWRHPTRIFGLACESDRVPAAWVACCDRFDLVVVPSRYCARSLRDSGVRAPILVVPHGLEPCYRPRAPKTRRRPFVFYNVLNAERPHRKSLPELLRAFRRAFAGRNDVVLRLRVERSREVRAVLAAAGVADHDPQILIDERTDLPTDAFAACYADVHCTVHPSRAEGFGLIPFQSIACETPVIAPAHTGMADFLDEGNAILLRSRADPARPADVYYAYGAQPVIDEDHLVALLRHAEAAWEQEYAKVRAAAPAFRARYAWPVALAELLALVRALVALPDAVARRALIRARVA